MNILLIIRNTEFLDALFAIFSDSNKVTGVTNSASGIVTAKQGEWDLIIIDSVLSPGETGLDLYLELREEESSTKFIVFSDLASRESNNLEIVSKPIVFRELLSMVKELKDKEYVCV